MLPEKIKTGRKPKPETIPIALLIAEFKSGKTIQQIAKQYSYTVDSITRLCRKHGFSNMALRAFQQQKADILAFRQSQIVGAMSTKKIKGASLRDQATAFNILHNAERLERGQSTQNIDMKTLNMQLAELEDEEVMIRKKLGALGG